MTREPLRPQRLLADFFGLVIPPGLNSLGCLSIRARAGTVRPQPKSRLKSSFCSLVNEI